MKQTEIQIACAGFNLGREVIASVEREYGLDPGTLLTRTRTKTVAQARRDAMRRAHEQTGLSNPEIAKLFDRDASTVWSALNT